MLTLSFPCVVTRLTGGPPLVGCRTWVEGDTFRALAMAAAQELDTSVDECTFALITPSHTARTVFLEVLHQDAEALVGPMAGPRPSRALSADCRYSLREMLTRLGFERDETSAHGTEPESAYIVVVRHAGVWTRVGPPTVREAGESDVAYRARRAAVEGALVERACREGFHVVRHSVPPSEWTLHDLEILLFLAYRLLPVSEPRWPESGWICSTPVANECADAAAGPAYRLHVSRGEYEACLQLPSFPTRALAQWLDGRRCDINLHHPVARLERLLTDWQCA